MPACIIAEPVKNATCPDNTCVNSTLKFGLAVFDPRFAIYCPVIVRAASAVTVVSPIKLRYCRTRYPLRGLSTKARFRITRDLLDGVEVTRRFHASQAGELSQVEVAAKKRAVGHARDTLSHAWRFEVPVVIGPTRWLQQRPNGSIWVFPEEAGNDGLESGQALTPAAVQIHDSRDKGLLRGVLGFVWIVQDRESQAIDEGIILLDQRFGDQRIANLTALQQLFRV